MNQPVDSSVAVQWLDEPEDLFKFTMDAMANREDGFSFPILEREHKLSVRLQFWTDLLDAKLRELHPQAMENVPKPKIWVGGTGGQNAFVHGTKRCISAEISKISGLDIILNYPVFPDLAYATPVLPLVLEWFVAMHPLEEDPSAELETNRLKKLIQRSNATAACDAFERTHEALWGIGKPLDTFPRGGVLPKEKIPKLLEFENSFRACAKLLSVKSPELKSFLIRIQNFFDSSYVQPERIVKLVKSSTVQTLDDLALRPTKSVVSKRKSFQALRQKSIDDRIGFYTTEQEADELSFEWMAAVGLNPLAAKIFG